MTALACPLCSVALTASSLEPHLRLELSLPLLKCSLCPQSFADTASADGHFEGPFASHPGSPPDYIRRLEEPAQTARLLELLRLARGGPEAVQQRLCVCGQCRLLCRDIFRSKPSSTAQAQLFQLGLRMPAAHEARPEPKAAAPGECSEEELPREVQNERIERVDRQDTSQEETPMLTDVKPNLAELKPQLAADSKVACLQCEKRVDKSMFSHHARVEHIPGNPFQCLTCPQNFKTRQMIGKHQKKDHGIEMSSATFTESLSKEVLQDWIKLCFGETNNVGFKKNRCRPCDSLFHPSDVKAHISTQHLNKPMFRCKICGLVSNSAKITYMNGHVKKAHKGTPGAETIDSSGMEQYEPIIKAMIPQLFEK